MAAPKDTGPGPKPIDGRVPPHNLQAEHTLLSAIMRSHSERPEGSHAMDQVVAMLHPTHFFSEANRRIFEACLENYGRGLPTDLVHVMTWLAEHDRLAQVGGKEHLVDIMCEAPAAPKLEKYARLIVDTWLRRQLIFKAARISAEGYGTIEDTKTFLIAASTELEQLSMIGPDAIELEEVEDSDDDANDDDDKFLVPALRIGEGRTTLIGGDSYTGKSVIAQSLAISIATGRDVWGVYHVETTGKVLHLNYDQSGKLAKRRYRRLRRAMKLPVDALKGKLKVANFPKLHLDDDAADAKLARLVRGYKLCVVDALVGFIRRTEEKSEHMGRLLLQLMRVSERTGCTFLVIHHTSKPGAQQKHQRPAKDLLRGSGAIFGSADSVLILQSTGKKKPVKVSHEKAPTDGQTLDDFYLMFLDIEKPRNLLPDDEPIRPKWGLEVVHVDAERYSREFTERKSPVDRAQAFEQMCLRVLELVKANPGSSSNQLYERCEKMRRATFLSALEDLARPQRAGGPLVVGVKGPRNSMTWRAV